MADKLKISKASSNQLNMLSTRLNLKRNIICRIAISVSLSTRKPVSETIDSDSDGYEFNKTTIMGPDEILFKSLSAFVQNKPADSDYFNIIIRNHIERGLVKMNDDFMQINSPVTYISSLLGEL